MNIGLIQCDVYYRAYIYGWTKLTLPLKIDQVVSEREGGGTGEERERREGQGR